MTPKKILIIYDYERIVPPFMQSLIKIWLGKFDEIKYITPPMPDNYNKLLQDPKIEIVTWNRFIRLKQAVKGITSIFRPSFWKEARNSKITKGAIAIIGQYFFCSAGFMDLSEPFIKKNIKEGNQVYLLATWFAVEAFTAARMKDKYPAIKAFALAHSGEVIKARNPYMHQTFHEYILEKINRVFFISRIVMKDYLLDMKDINIKERFGEKITPIYLGSIKSNDLMNPENVDEKLHIISCSRIDPNKRLDRIIDTLTKWSGPIIKWTHIGSGESEQEIKTEVTKLIKLNPKVEIDFLGQLDNYGVIDYYSKNHVDLFINVSKSEGLPISIMEAMSYGIPCIATNVGGTSEIVNNTNGFLLNQNFTDADLLTILRNYTSLSYEQKQTLRANAFQTWKNKFNAKVNALDMYNQMVKTNK